MLSSPRRPSSTMRIFSSAEYCLRVARRMSWTTFSAGSFDDRVCCLIFAPVNVTMSQKLSLLQSANSVSWALMADRSSLLSHLRSCERYDEPETLPSSICQFCLMGADGGQCAHLVAAGEGKPYRQYANVIPC